MSDPAEKYRDKVSPEHEVAMSSIGAAYHILAMHRAHFKELIEAERRSHSIGHMIDPTLYRDMISSKSFALQLKLINAAVAFLDAADPIVAEVEKR
jgi:hypothetical protein